MRALAVAPPPEPSPAPDLRAGEVPTQVSRATAAALVAAFLLALAALPVGQAVLEWRRGDESPLRDLFRRAPTRANLAQWEKEMEDASTPREWAQPRVQAALVRWGGFGNAKAVVGRDGWLYYQPGVMAVAGPGILDPDAHEARRRQAVDDGEAPPAADPRPAILAFHRALAARGVRLVLFPVPDKATVQPAQLHGRARGVVPAPVNRDHARLVHELRDAGVAVFDPTPLTVDTAAPPRFLAQDTHWTPEWMRAVAGDLARFVASVAPLPPARRAWRVVEQRVTRVGDIVDMLKLPEGQTLFAPQSVTVAQMQDAAGAPWQPSERADVLLLGDSFTNIYSLDAMGWGEAAGLAPHLALALGRDVDVLARNDAGAYATRKLLAEALAAGEDRLAGKRVVIWELAARELAVGDFRPFDYKLGRPRP